MIEICVEANDFSPLVPLSIRDLIWLRVGLALKMQRDAEERSAERTANSKTAETLYLVLCDLRAVALDFDFFGRVSALKGTKTKKIKAFDVKRLPSCTAEEAEERRQEEERRAKMTPEERAAADVAAFMAGKVIRA